MTGVALEALATLPDLYSPAASPSGDEIAFYWDVTGRNELHLLDVESGETRQVTHGEAPRDARTSITWGEAGERLYCHRDDDGDEQFDILAVDPGGTADEDERNDESPAVEVVVDREGQSAFKVTDPSGRHLLFTSTADGQLNCYVRDTRTGETEQLTDYDEPVRAAAFGPAGDRVAYTTDETDERRNADLYVAKADGSDPERLPVGEPGSVVGLADWSRAGAGLLVSDDATGLRRPGVVDPDAGTVSWFGGEHEESALEFGPAGERFLALRKRRAAEMPVVYQVDAAGEADEEADGTGRELDVPEGVTENAGFLDEETVWLLHSTPTRRKELLAYDLATDQTRVLVAAQYGDVDPDAFVDAEFVSYESVDGLEIGALLYDPGEHPSAGVVKVHGGPQYQSTKLFDEAAQFLASRGYAVLLPNYRGSTGRGREFLERIIGDWGGGEQADVAMAGEWLKAREWIDEERVAVMGSSYGGYSTYMQLVCYPNSWAAGIAIVGITDLHRLHEESMPQFQAALEEQLGDREANADLWRNRSAVTHVENAGFPLQVLHGVNDPRCPISQARLFRDALEARCGWTEGGEFEYHELGERGHGSTDADHRTEYYRLLAGFLEERL